MDPLNKLESICSINFVQQHLVKQIQSQTFCGKSVSVHLFVLSHAFATVGSLGLTNANKCSFINTLSAGWAAPADEQHTKLQYSLVLVRARFKLQPLHSQVDDAC